MNVVMLLQSDMIESNEFCLAIVGVMKRHPSIALCDAKYHERFKKLEAIMEKNEVSEFKIRFFYLFLQVILLLIFSFRWSMNKFLGNMSYPIYHNRQKIGLRPIFWRSIDFDVLFQTLLYLYFIVVLYIKFNALNFFEIKKSPCKNENR